jgi:hypothetical protein
MIPDWGENQNSTTLEQIIINGQVLKLGDHVQLQPKHRADAFDILLTGRKAVIEAIEQDFENRVYLALTIDDDPGQDLGFQRQSGHRFFFAPDEVIPLGTEPPHIRKTT